MNDPINSFSNFESSTESDPNRQNLTAVREAAASFQSPYFIKSETFEKLIERRRNLTNRFEAVKNDLIERLFREIEKSSDDAVRRKMINIKRAVFNNKNLSPPADFALPEDIAENFAEYNEILFHLNNIFEPGEFLKEIEEACKNLLKFDEFRSSLDYSCPHLSIDKLDSLKKFSDRLQAFSTIYSYALKHVVKTPPLHTYSKISISSAYGEIEKDSVETVINVELISGLEKSNLKKDDFRSNVRLLIASGWRVKDLYFFLLIDECDVRVEKYVLTPALSRLIGILKNSGVLQEELYESLTDINREEIFSLVEKLKSDGIVTETLIEDVENPFKNLISSETEKEDSLTRLWKNHGTITPESKFFQRHYEIIKDLKNLDVTTSRPYFAYNYGGNIEGSHKKTAGLFTSDLEKIGDILSISDTNYTQNLNLKSVIGKCFENRPNLRMSFPELISRVLYKTIRREEIEGVADRIEKRFEAIESVKTAISGFSGTIDQTAVESLKKFLPEKDFRRKPISVVGNVDFISPRFYLHNIFAGNSRFLTKYLIKREPLFKERENHLRRRDVEVVPAWDVPHHRVRQTYRTGFSFDPRCRTLFENFIDFEEIEAGWDDEPVFYNRVSGEKLKFHYRGLALLRRLSLPYKILLSDHADFFDNIFDLNPPRCDRKEIAERGAINFESLCLRRACVCAGADLLEPFILEKELLKGAFFFREFLKNECRVDSEFLYFRLVRNGEYVSMPRFLNLLHPLSWSILKKTIQNRVTADSIHFTRCEPLPSQMPEKDGENYFTEFMIEV